MWAHVLDDVVDVLVCPYCGDGLVPGRLCVRCGRGHSFDVARQGYVSLLPPGSRGVAGDTATMISQRAGFLGAGHFEPLTAGLADHVEALLGGAAGGHVVDIGAGTGHHLSAVLGRLPGRAGVAVDVSKYACRRAAKAHERIGAVVADAWRAVPVRDSSVPLVLNVFAPRNAAEMHRVLRPDGHLVVVTPDSEHLAELVPALGMLGVDARKRDRLDQQLGGLFCQVDDRGCRFTMALGREEVQTLVRMGPSAHHSERESLAERAAALPDPVAVTGSVTLSTYRPRRASGPSEETA